MAATRIQLCGRVAVELDGRRVERDLPGRQGRLLFVYLVLNRLRPVGRSELVEALWPAKPPPGADSGLSALLSKLRRALGEGRIEGRGGLRLVLPAGAWVDLEAAREALHRAEGAAARGDWASVWGPARVAQHIARRGFLLGEDVPWADECRRDLEVLYAGALELAAEACLAIGGSELDTAERTARTLVEQAPHRESGYRHLMRTLAARGNVAEALKVYDALRRRLRDDLGVAPGPATQDLYRRLLG